MTLPDDFINRMKEYLKDDYEAFIASYNEPNVKGLRFNPVGGNMSPAVSFGDSVRLENVPWEKCGFSYIADESAGMSFGKHPYHDAGLYYIQEPSAMSSVYYLDVKPGERILDLCASPGGKSTQIGSKMQGKGILVANEINLSRAKILSENIERMGIKNALVINEEPNNISDKFEGFFDKVLVDAPCSGEGMFRRLQTAIDEWSLDNVLMCAKRQEKILDEAARMLKEGGTLVYSTCTFSKEENEDNIAAFLRRHSDFELAEMEMFTGIKKGFDGIGVRLYPHKVNGEGHFVCKLIRNGKIAGEKYKGTVMQPGIVTNPGLSDMYSFLRENLKETVNEEIMSKKLTMFGDNIYMLPDECPLLKGLKVLRAGLHIGTMKKNRFEPSHALAMSLTAADVYKCINITLNSDKECGIFTPLNNNNVIYKYLSGETFNISDITGSEADSAFMTKDGNNSDNYKENYIEDVAFGWNIVCIDGISLGWGKVISGIVKNHYPKGLRKKHNIL